MFYKEDLIRTFTEIGIKPTDTLLVHSSMKAVGSVENGADTVLDAFMDYMKDGLLVFPTHTWAQMNEEYNIFDPETEPSCVGLLSNLFRRHPGVLRSLHPTHSVAAYGADAAAFVSGEERWDTPCPRGGCWGKLYDRKAKVLFLGCSLRSNTFLHGVEEWNHVAMRLAETRQPLKVRMPDGTLADTPQHRHFNAQCDVSDHYGKMLEPFLYLGIAKKGRIGAAESYLCDACGMADVTSVFLKRCPDLFLDEEPVPAEWYEEKR